MFGVKQYLFSGLSLFSLSIIAGAAFCAELSISTEVQGNITTLQQTKNCPQCDLSGANLNRMDLSGANLEGANLSRAKLNLANLTGANLRKADLRDVVFGGADLAEADLRGADLRGTSFAGAYMSGILLDGELITTNPYAQEQMSNVEETLYVEDTVKPKIAPKTEEMNIGARRDFEEIPPTLPVEQPSVAKENIDVDETDGKGMISERLVPQESAAAPESKNAPSIQQVRVSAVEAQTVHVTDNESRKNQQITIPPEEDIRLEEQLGSESLPQPQKSIERGEATITAISSRQPIKDDDEPDVTATAIPAVPEPVIATDLATGKGDGDETNRQVMESDSTVVQSISDNNNSEPDNTIDASMVRNELAFETKVEQVNSDSGMDSAALSMDSEVLRNVELLLDTNQCYGCNLEGADLSGKDLDESDLEGANLKKANLEGVDLNKANLKGANLSGADLRKADLDGADLYKADLTNADLTEASLEGTLIDDAVLTGVKGYKQGTLLIVD